MISDEQKDHIDLDDLYSHLQLPTTSFSIRVDSLVTWTGEFFSWCWPLLLLVIVANVVMRYLFGEGRIEFEEIQWHIYSAGFLMGLSYTYTADDHVRVDIFRERMGFVSQAWIEFYGILLLLVPFLLLVITYSIPFVWYSFQMNEVSEAPGGLPFRWVVKSFLLLGFIFLLLSALSRLCRLSAFLFGWPNVADKEANIQQPTSDIRADK
jgi:TRAP-type mannitol/chloroaromatic compound transport system permease small subunit